MACAGAVWETVGGAAGAELCDRLAVLGPGSDLADAGNDRSVSARRNSGVGHIGKVAACLIKPSGDNH